jgi:RNA polymerase sigma factor (sigma-70 family)
MNFHTGAIHLAPTDAQLVQLAREDDKYAFNLLMERYQVMAACIALRMISNEETAHDLVQEAMLQAFLSLDRLRDDTHFKSWFYGIVLNVCRNSRREGRTETVSLNTPTGNWLSELHHSWEEQADPQVYIEQQELRIVLDESLNTLSIKNRTVAQLFYYEEMSIQEIAHKLAISQTAVKNRLYKSREQLRAHLLKTSPDMMPPTTRKRGKDTMIKVSIAKVIPQQNYRTLVVLQDKTQQRVLSIWLKVDWTDPIDRMRMLPQTQNAPAEPLTTDFMVNLLQATGSTISSIEIENLQDELLYARVHIQSHGEERHLKARLNDAIPLALRLNSDLYVADAVMEKLGQKLPTQTKMSDQIDTMSKALTDKMYTGMMGQTAVTRKEPRNLDFSDGLHGWWFIGFPKDASTYQIDQTVKRSTKGSLLITNQDAQPVSSAVLYHEGFLADNYLSKRLRLYASVKTNDVKHVAIVVELNGSREALRLRQVSAPIIRGTTNWTTYEIIFDVPNDTAFIKFSLRMMGAGRVWLDKIGFEEVDSSMPLTEDAGPRIPFPDEPQNTHFAYNLAHWDLWGNYPQDYICGIDTVVGINGATCGYIKASAPAPRGHGILRQTIRSKCYHGHYVRLIGNIKTADVENQASLYMQLDSIGNDGFREKSLQGTTDWSEQDVVMFVPEQGGGMIRFGIILHGKGQIWLDNVRLEIVESEDAVS